jgi:hypothetical protein
MSEDAVLDDYGLVMARVVFEAGEKSLATD